MKRTKTPSRRRKTPRSGPRPSKKYAIIKIGVPAPTRKQLDALRKLFKAKAVSTLGISPTTLITTRQWAAAKRPKR